MVELVTMERVEHDEMIRDAVSAVKIALQPKYGAFPLPDTILRHRQLALPLKTQRRNFYQREMKRRSAVKKLFERVEGATS